ncbi:MAG TPA: penicillin-binding protein 1C [Candidatus Baltobacteraceae bacterium]|nr:penicillin-binding protein 1C [Candidatus Baltobacteraceae bacterium]
MNHAHMLLLRRIRLFLPLALLGALAAMPYAFAVHPSAIRPAGTAVTFSDRSGIPLGTVVSSRSRRAVAVPLERVSPLFISAALAAEDRRFYAHGAVDWISAARAAWQSIRCLCVQSGASTIDMQVARMSFSLGGGLRGKISQVWDAARIDAGSDKHSILSAYVNRVAMGGDIYGVEAAARTYFGVPASGLDLAQSALLAGIPNDPVRLNPRSHWQSARARQRYVLARMAADGLISSTQLSAAQNETLHLRRHDTDLAAAQQLLFALAAQTAQGDTPVRTTIDLPLQRFVQAQAQDVIAALASHNVTQACALVIDNRSGEVLAYLGSLDYFDDAYLGRNDGVQALRQPGSTLKPFLYEYAFERHAIAPRTILADVPSSYAIPNGEIYSPQDYDRRFSGPVSVRTALANSLNVPAVHVLSRVGVAPFLDRLHALGFSHLRRTPAYYGLGLTLGAGEVTLWDLAHAYVTLARNGSAIPLRTLADAQQPPAEQIGDPAYWKLVTDILSDRYARAQAFGLGSVIDMPFPAAVKTGTSSGYRDTWTVGYTPEYTVAVWVGNFTGAPMQRVAGVSGAGPLWNRIMLHLYEHRDPARFERPPSNLIASAPVSAAAARSQQYDEWRMQQDYTTGALHILFPHDGDTFEDTLSRTDPHRSEQQLAFRISRPAGAKVAWTLNGRTMTRSTGDAYYWTLEPGMWTLTVSANGTAQTVRFAVVRRMHNGKRGFILSRS